MAGLAVKEITERFIARHSEDFEYKVTPRWVGNVIRKKLGFKTYRRGGAYYVAESEKEKLDRLFDRYGLHEGGEVGADGRTETPGQPEDNLPLLE